MIALSFCRSQCNSGEIRLSGGSSSNEGRVEACIDEQWGTLCATESEWTLHNTHVACRQLGFSTQGLCSGNIIVCAHFLEYEIGGKFMASSIKNTS